MKTFTIILTWIAVTLLLFSCQHDKLTPITQLGKNTFSCKVNGKVWIPNGKGDMFASIPPIGSAFYKNSSNDSLRIWITTYKDNGDRMEIYLSSLTLGKHKLDAQTFPIGQSFSPSNYGLFSTSGEKYITSFSNVGTVTILKSDTLTGILAGTFEFTASAPNGDGVKITAGRFDINSKTL